MRYLCLVYAEEKKLEDLPDSDCVAYGEALRNNGHAIAAEALQPVQTATTVRVRNGKVSITDGPFAETQPVEKASECRDGELSTRPNRIKNTRRVTEWRST